MIWFLIGLALGFVLGSICKHIELQSAYIKRLEEIAYLVGWMKETRGIENRRLTERGRKDLN
jgi:hypothetical protein